MAISLPKILHCKSNQLFKIGFQTWCSEIYHGEMFEKILILCKGSTVFIIEDMSLCVFLSRFLGGMS